MQANNADSILSSTGAVARLLAGRWEARPQQLRMAEAVSQAMNTATHLLAEAGTGVGKSFAYLVPAMLRCMAGETVVVSTHTISLQEQLFDKDIPLLMRAMGVEPSAAPVEPDLPEFPDDPAAPAPPAPAIRPVLVKGRGNYMSIRRLALASQRQERLFPDAAARRSLHVIEDWASSTLDGTVSSLPRLERPGIWNFVVSDSGNCMGRKCPTYKECYYQRARRKSEQANLLVCNHALFFADLALRTQDVSILPDYQHVVLDEAHTVEDVASEHFGVSLAEGRVNFLLGNLFHPRSQRGFLPTLSLHVQDAAPVDRAVALVTRAQDISRRFFESLVDLVQSAGEARRAGGEPVRGANTLRIRVPGVVPNILTQVMNDLALRLSELKTLCKNDADVFELNSYAVRAQMIAADAETLLSQRLANYAYWVEISGADDDFSSAPAAMRVELACAPVEVADILRERLFRQKFSVTLASATLATRTVQESEPTESRETGFAHLMSRLGCEGAGVFQAGSPFDYARQVQVFVPGSHETSPNPYRGHSHWLADQILRHVQATDGGAFVLFTSFATLNAVASELAVPLAELGMPMLAQGRDGSRTLILQRFRESDRSVLLGAASFWQGVDVQGRALRNVIITKLPFDPPDRPLTQARLELIEQRGGNPFMEDSLPRAVIKFKQGFGRLIRSKTDSGRVVVLDHRITTARYGRYFLRALPEGVQIVTE